MRLKLEIKQARYQFHELTKVGQLLVHDPGSLPDGQMGTEKDQTLIY